ncbi:MAG: hypothetical protein U0V75_11705 [Ferruginibacter sp.]|mgnify:CR=1 FL=1
MSKIFTFLLLVASTVASAQLSEKQLKELHERTAKAESSRVQLEAAMKESQRRADSINMAAFNEQNTRNLNAFAAARKEQERKSMIRMYWRLGFGAIMMVILVVGWSRKRKTA